VKYVIIGGSAAGISAAESIRKSDRSCQLTIISEEGYPAYSRCLLSNFIAGDRNRDDMLFRPGDFYSRLDIEPINAKAVGINPEQKKVKLANGEDIEYDKLLIATGSLSSVPQITGQDAEGVFNLRTLADAQRLVHFIQTGAKRAVVLGGGLIGCKIAEALTTLNLKTTLVEKESHLLPRIVDVEASNIVSDLFIENGVELIVDQEISEIRTIENRVVAILLQNGDELLCDVLILAMGVKPNVEIALQSGIHVEVGIVVDEHLQTSVDDIYAAGDVVQTWNRISGEYVLTPTWVAASEQGRTAGYNMSGMNRVYDTAMIANSIEVFTLPIMSAGILVGDEDITDSPHSKAYRRVVIKDGKVVGLVFVGHIRNAGVIYGLMKRNAAINSLKDEILNEHFSYAYLFKHGPKEPGDNWIITPG